MKTAISGCWCWPLRLVSCLTIGGAIAFTSSSGEAQIVPDKTLGSESSFVKPGEKVNGLSGDPAGLGNALRIDGGAVRGANLFHSFQQFNVGGSERVYFANPTGIENIFSRVTGKTPSNILGTLGVLGNANLFLLNPNGIVFGPHAQLDVRGSFVASTANSLKWNDNTFFSATNPTAPPLLTINVPIGLQFGTQQPAAIVNGGQLAVPQGQNLSLLGGTVVSTGQLLGGQVSVASVPGMSWVQLSSSGVPLSISPTPPNPQVALSYPPDLSQLLNGAPSGSNLGVTLNGNGEVKLAGSDLKVADGDVVVRHLTSGNATLSAANNLTLVESHLNATGNLNLLAHNTVQVRDSVALPFFAGAGGKLLIQGNHIDIFALNHPQSGFVSGGDMVLRANAVVGDARYNTGGNFRIEQPDGSLGNLYSPTDPVIRASGDVSFGSYIGASLHIFAGGSVTIPGGVVIGAADPVNGIVDNVQLSNGTTVSINSRTQPTLDVRAGTTAVGSAGIPRAVPPLGTFNPAPPNPNGTPTSANITIGNITNSGGLVFLTNQYQPNPSLPGGAINVGAIITGSQSGNGASVFIDSRGTIALKDTLNTSSGNFIQGKGGDITLIGNGDITTSDIFSLGGLGGNINLTSNGTISLQDRLIGSVSFTPIPGTRGGDINVKARSLFLTNGARIIAVGAIAAGGGNLNVNVAQSQEASGETGGLTSSTLQVLDTLPATAKAQATNLLTGNPGSGLYALTFGTGAAGNINIQTGRLTLRERAQVSTSTSGSGRGGNLTVNAGEAVELIGNNPPGVSGLFTEAIKGGDAGNLTIHTGRLIVRGGANVSTTTFGPGKGGNLDVHAGEFVELSGVSPNGQSPSLLAAATLGAGQAGDLTVNTRRLIVRDGALVAAPTLGVGNGGKLTVNATESVEVIGKSPINIIPSALATDTFNTVNNPTRAGDAGNLEINTRRLSVRDGGIVSASTWGTGQGGSLIVNAQESVEVSGKPVDGVPSGLYSQGFGAANAGNLQVNTPALAVRDGARVTVATGSPTSDLAVTSPTLSFGAAQGIVLSPKATGNAGEMRIRANSIRLDNQGQLIAKTESGEGGNINIQARDLILMRRNSQIFTNASSGTGNGGNMDINSQFIVAVPNENSDITANAVQGRGGNIKITTSSIYGLQFRPRQTPQSDITASSDYGLQGVVQINTLDLDPSKRIVALPQNVVDVSRLVASGCGASARQQPSRFVVTGRGGVPSNPNETLRSYDVLVDLGSNPNGGNTRVSHSEHRSTVAIEMVSTSPQHKGTSAARIVEATGWVIGSKGEVILTANPPNVSSHGSWQTTPSCQIGNR